MFVFPSYSSWRPCIKLHARVYPVLEPRFLVRNSVHAHHSHSGLFLDHDRVQLLSSALGSIQCCQLDTSCSRSDLPSTLQPALRFHATSRLRLQHALCWRSGICQWAPSTRGVASRSTSRPMAAAARATACWRVRSPGRRTAELGRRLQPR